MEGIEFYIYEDKLWIMLQDGTSKEVEESDTELVQTLFERIKEQYPEAFKALSRNYSSSSPNVRYFQFLIVRRFCKCNFGKLDTTKIDVERTGRMNFEKVDCPLRGECQFEGVICTPKFNSNLSTAELRVMKLVYQGSTIEEIASALFLSPYTVKNHIKSVYCKLNIHEKSEFIRYANEKNLFYV